MIDIKNIKPIPKYILRKIKTLDKKYNPYSYNRTRFYKYLTKFNNELAIVTVAVKNRYKEWHCKQVVVHGVHTDKCYLKDIVFYQVAGYIVGWFSEGLTKEPKWFEYDEWGYNTDKYFKIDCPTINKEYALSFDRYKYSAIERYPYNNILKYLRLYEKYPEIELLVKFGLYNYCTSITLLRLIHKDNKFRKWIIKNKEKLAYTNNYYISSIIKAYKTKQDLDKVQRFEIFLKTFSHDDNYQRVKRLFNGNIETFYNYIQSQNISSENYIDYLNACEYLKLNMNENKNKVPYDFNFWHNVRIDEYHLSQLKKDKEKRKSFYKKFSAVAKKYLSMQKTLNDTYCVIIAKSPEDLIKEGQTLHHCVGKMNYDQKFVQEETLIFFVRAISNPQTPFITLEYSIKSHKILQCYASHNAKPDNEILDCLNTVWLPYANKQIKKLAI